MIAVPCYERKRIVELCLPTIALAQRPQDKLMIYNDGSTSYSDEWLEQWGDQVIGTLNIGIERQRKMHLEDFFISDFTHLFFTDSDAVTDPYAIEFALALQEQHSGLPVCMYNTKAHSEMLGNTLYDNPESNVILRRYAPGISYLLSRDHVKTIMRRIKEISSFDWQVPEWLGGRFAVSRISYHDHIGKGGLHDPFYEGYDGGDRAISPTTWLIAKRKEIVEKLTAQQNHARSNHPQNDRPE